MAIVVQLRLVAHEGKGAELKSFLETTLPGTRQAQGCRGLVMARDPKREIAYTILQVWDSKDDYRTYSRWRLDRGDLTPFDALLAEPPDLRFLDVVSAYP